MRKHIAWFRSLEDAGYGTTEEEVIKACKAGIEGTAIFEGNPEHVYHSLFVEGWTAYDSISFDTDEPGFCKDKHDWVRWCKVCDKVEPAPIRCRECGFVWGEAWPTTYHYMGCPETESHL